MEGFEFESSYPRGVVGSSPPTLAEQELESSYPLRSIGLESQRAPLRLCIPPLLRNVVPLCCPDFFLFNNYSKEISTDQEHYKNVFTIVPATCYLQYMYSYMLSTVYVYSYMLSTCMYIATCYLHVYNILQLPIFVYSKPRSITNQRISYCV